MSGGLEELAERRVDMAAAYEDDMFIRVGSVPPQLKIRMTAALRVEAEKIKCVYILKRFINGAYTFENKN